MGGGEGREGEEEERGCVACFSSLVAYCHLRMYRW